MYSRIMGKLSYRTALRSGVKLIETSSSLVPENLSYGLSHFELTDHPEFLFQTQTKTHKMIQKDKKNSLNDIPHISYDTVDYSQTYYKFQPSRDDTFLPVCDS